MLRAVGEGSAHLGRGRRRSRGHSSLSVCWLWSGLRREDRIHSPGYPEAPPLHLCSHFGRNVGRSPAFSCCSPQGQMKGPTASGQSLRPRPVRPPDGRRGREDGLLPKALGVCLRGFGIRDLRSAPLAPAAVSRSRRCRSATTGPDNGHSGGRRATSATAHNDPRACPSAGPETTIPSHPRVLALQRCPAPSGNWDCGRSTKRRAG